MLVQKNRKSFVGIHRVFFDEGGELTGAACHPLWYLLPSCITLWSLSFPMRRMLPILMKSYRAPSRTSRFTTWRTVGRTSYTKYTFGRPGKWGAFHVSALPRHSQQPPSSFGVALVHR